MALILLSSSSFFFYFSFREKLISRKKIQKTKYGSNKTLAN